MKRTWEHDPALYAPPRYRRACRYEAFLPDPLGDLSPALPGEQATVVSDAEAAIVRLSKPDSPALAPLARLLLRTESIASSKVEGMQVDARTLARAEVAQDLGRIVGPEATEVIANIDAMQFAIENASRRKTTPSSILSIHKVLMKKAPNAAIAGRFRDKQNWIGGNDYNACGADYVPPPPENVAGLIKDLCRFSNREDLPPLVLAAIAHAQFETIHPFEDGNGRTGRALIHVLLRRRGLTPTFVPPVSVVFAANKRAYIRGLTAFREGRISDWIETFSSSAARAAALAEHYLARVGALQERWRSQLRKRGAPRADAASWAIIDILPAHPVITLPVGVVATKRTKPAVNNAIAQLVRAGVLNPVSTSQRNRAWEAVGLLDLVAGLEAGAFPT